jgi:hypothetical protein
MTPFPPLKFFLRGGACLGIPLLLGFKTNMLPLA